MRTDIVSQRVEFCSCKCFITRCHFGICMAKFGGSDNKTLIDVVKADAVPVASGAGAKLTTPVMTIENGNAGGEYRLFVWNNTLEPLANVLP